ncbi:MAG: efflux RND transporter periplasmic adaptor subunit [Steroidobacteraceae bacterium]
MKRRTVLLAALPVLVAALLLIGGIVARERALGNLSHVAKARSVAAVQVIAPTRGPTKRPLVLPGTVSAWYQAPIFAQVSGYVHSWYVDYGATVKAGQLLATIDTPSLDAQYAAAKADMHVAQANYRLAVITAKRWQALAGTVAVSQQEVDVQTAGAEAREAELEAASQNVARYVALEAFKRVVAPFDGVVTARLTDVGSYVNAAGGDQSVRGASTELFTVADVHAVRVFVSVPQDYADQLVPGLTAVIHLPSQPGHLIEATFLTTARAFSTNTRTAVTELTVDNSNHALWPGTYVDVTFQVPSDPNVLTMPEEALIFRAAGTQVAIVDANNRVHLRDITLGQNLGQTVQVTSGLAPGDRLVNNPPSGLMDGETVQPVTPVPGYASAPKNPPVQPQEPPPPQLADDEGHTSTP